MKNSILSIAFLPGLSTKRCPGGDNNNNLFSHSSRPCTWTSRILVELASPEASVFGLQMAERAVTSHAPSLCVECVCAHTPAVSHFIRAPIILD